MNLRAPCLAALAGLVLALLPAAALAARVNPDIPPPQKRQATVTVAEKLAEKRTPSALPADLASPFNPPSFDRPEQGDPANAPIVRGGSPKPAPRVLTTRETLETLAAQINPSGVMMLRDTPRLVIGNKPFEVGTRFTATYNNQDYELELVAIDRTTFTLRYRGEEITRPIKPVR
ncbi:MAG: hypothetical protein JNL92_21485 [Opitutaceae bacterium]|nr:hypothetical protein [Opitutaceae bacterium]